MRARALAVFLVVASLLAVVSPAYAPLRDELTGTVVRTVDGDTVWVRLAGGVEKVRYIGIDTPEVHHPTRGEEPGGPAATEIKPRPVRERPVPLQSPL